MDFAWSDSEQELYQAGHDFARARIRRDGERPTGFSRERFAQCGEFGLMGLSVPSTLGGMGLGALATARVVEGFSKGARDPGLMFSACAHLFACVMPIVESGSEALKDRIVPRLSRGEWVGANAITEAEAGSDVFGLKTSAVRDGDAYVLDGTKTYVTNGPEADVLVVYAVTNPKHGYLGLSAFVVESSTPGVVRGKPFEKIGLAGSATGQVYLQSCRVPAANRIGPEGSGASVFNASMGWERACLFALYLGAMEDELETTIEFARTRKQGGKSIGKHQAVSHRIVDMKLRLEMSRLLLYRACWRFDQKQDAAIDIGLSKLAVSEAAVESAMDAMRVHGGLGVMSEVGIEAHLRDALPGLIFSGTSEIQREMVATRLGL